MIYDLTYEDDALLIPENETDLYNEVNVVKMRIERKKLTDRKGQK